MTLSDIQTIAKASNVMIAGDARKITIDGPDSAVDELIPLVRRWKPELIQLLKGETISDVGSCDHCNADLIGLVTFDGYTNRTCPACGKWFRCLEPIEQARESRCAGKHNGVESTKVAASLAGLTTVATTIQE